MAFLARLQLRARQKPLRAASRRARDPMPASRSASKTVSGRAPRGTTARQAGSTALRVLPQVHAVLQRDELRQAAERHGRALVTGLVRERLDALRREVRAGRTDGAAVESELAGLPAWVEREAGARTASTLRPVINATGVILHTNFGRAVLPENAALRMTEVARAYTTLEYDLAGGGRGSRPLPPPPPVALAFPRPGVLLLHNHHAGVLPAPHHLPRGPG